MENGSKGNLIINGVGSSNGGTVHLAKIEGVGKVEGDIICSDFVLNGKADIHGNIKASYAEINGAAAVKGNLQTERLRIHGKVTVDGDLITDSIQIHGIASVKGSCETENFDGVGRFHMNGLNAGRIQVALQGSSSIVEIGGEHIHIRKQTGIDFAKWLKGLPLSLGNKLTAQTIEGDYIYVEYTSAEIIRGAEVAIGPGCEIGIVEYKTKYSQDKSSNVKKHGKL